MKNVCKIRSESAISAVHCVLCVDVSVYCLVRVECFDFIFSSCLCYWLPFCMTFCHRIVLLFFFLRRQRHFPINPHVFAVASVKGTTYSSSHRSVASLYNLMNFDAELTKIYERNANFYSNLISFLHTSWVLDIRVQFVHEIMPDAWFN